MFTFLHLASVDGQLAGGGDGAQVVVEALDRGRPLGRGLFLRRRRAQNVSWQQQKRNCGGLQLSGKIFPT